MHAAIPNRHPSPAAPLSLLARCVRLLCLLSFLVGVVLYVRVSLHWPMVWDTPVIHYVNFLADHGLRPYRDITDMNMPGAYLTERWGMAIFGRTDLGWRLFEFSTLTLMTLAMVIIGGARDWFGGLYAGLFYIVMHGSEGSILATERDQLMTILVVVSYALLFLASRRRLPVLTLGFGLAAGLATSIKPTVLPLALLLLALLAIHLARSGTRWLPYLTWGLLGLVLAGLLDLAFLIHYQAFTQFFFLLHTIVPSYAGLRSATPAQLLRHLLPVTILVMAVLAIVTAGLARQRGSWEHAALLLGVLAGAFSYFAQGKGFIYHRYLLVALLLLLIGLTLSRALHATPPAARAASITALLFTAVVIGPYYAHIMWQAAARHNLLGAEMEHALQADLTTLGGSSLQHQVQCLDLIEGCLSTLYQMQLVQNTGFTGDLLFFSPTDGPAVRYYRTLYAETTVAHPPSILVLGEDWWQMERADYAKINTWPAFAADLRDHYTLVRSWRDIDPRLPPTMTDHHAPAYRIYIRKESPILALAPLLPPSNGD